MVICFQTFFRASINKSDDKGGRSLSTEVHIVGVHGWVIAGGEPVSPSFSGLIASNFVLFDPESLTI